MTTSERSEQEWAAQWKRAATALAAVRARDLAVLSDEAALTAADELLSLVGSGELPPSRRNSSGLVEWQRALRRRRR